MTEEQIIARLQDLYAQRDAAQANYHAILGAIQDAEWFLAETRKAATNGKVKEQAK